MFRSSTVPHLDGESTLAEVCVDGASLPLRQASAGLLAATLSGVILWSAGDTGTLAAACALFLFLVVHQDVLHRRIPNLLTLPALGLALAYSAWAGGGAGLLSSFLGTALVFVALFLPFALRGLGAGDVKALMVLGALLGPSAVLGIVCWSLIAGGLIALAILVVRGGLAEMLARWAHSLGVTLATKRWTYLRPGAEAPARGGLPFGVAIALGLAALQLWGAPWEVLGS